MSEKKGSIGIIGAGVAGLAAGCYARMNGYKTTIFEAHHLPGGLCTSWKKEHYTIDGCIQWLVGTSPQSGLHQGWLELGALQGKTFINHEIYVAFESSEGRRVTLYSDVNRLEKHLLEFSPRDASLIRLMCGQIRFFSKLDKWNVGWADLFLAPVYLWKLGQAFLTSTQKFANRFKDPFLKEVFNLPGMGEFPVGIFFLTMAWHHNHNGGYPLGGSLHFAQGIEKRFLQLGGEIHYESRVDKILARNGKAVGLKLVNGAEHYFDRVIAAGDGTMTFKHLLEGKYNDEKLYRRFERLKPFNSMVLFSYGVRRDLSHEPQVLIFPLDEPIRVGGVEQKRMMVQHYAYDASLAPQGHTVLKVSFETDYDYWKKLHQDTVLYKAEKHALSLMVLERLAKRFPGIENQVEMMDVATPTTFEHFTSNWRGSIEGWLPTLSGMMPLPKTLESLKNLYFAGQWVQPGGGLPTCLMTGKGIVRKICKEDGKSFVTSYPPRLQPKPHIPPAPERVPELKGNKVMSGLS